MQQPADAQQKVPDIVVGTGDISGWTKEDEFFDMLEELPSPGQLEGLIARLPTGVLRRMASDLLYHNVRVAKDKSLYPYTFVKDLSSWVATAQEVAASKGRVNRVLREREEMKGAR